MITLFEHIAVIVFIFISLVSSYLFFQDNIHFIFRYIARLPKKRILIGIAAIFIVTSAFSKTYYIGGDDTHLYFQYPELYLQNHGSKIVTENALSNIGNFIPANSLASFLVFLIVLKNIMPWANLQSLLYALNIVGGIYFSYRLISYVITLFSKNQKINSFTQWGAFISSLMYTFSSFNAYTLYNSRLIAIFLVSTFPLILYLFIKAVLENKPHLLAIIAIVATVFCIPSVASIWFLASLLVFTPLIIFLLQGKIVRMLVFGGILLIFLVILNFHWLVYIPQTSLHNSAGSNSFISQNFLTDTAAGIKSTSEINELLYPLLNVFHRQIQLNFNWPYLPIYTSWYLRVLPLNVIFPLIIFAAGLFITKSKKFYLICAFCFLLSLYFFTVNIGVFSFGNIGITVFVWLSKVLPGFVMFRNMYDKFAHSVSLSYALLFAVSLYLLLEKISLKKINNFILLVSFIVVLINAKPLIFNNFNSLPIWMTQNAYTGIHSLNQNYIDLVNYVHNQPYSGRYAFLPLAGGNVISIRDQFLSNHYYIGVSPFLILSGKNDYSGTLSFGGYQDQLNVALKNQDARSVGEIFQKMNVRYIVLNNNIDPQLQRGSVYPDDLYTLQNKLFINQLLGMKVKDFGNDYSLHKINSDFVNDKLMLTDSPILFNENTIDYIRVDSGKYLIKVNPFKGEKTFIFLDEQNYSWQLTSADTGENIGTRILDANKYQNKWRISDQIFKNGSPAQLILYFKPYSYYTQSVLISVIGYIGITIYALYKISYVKK